MISKQFFVAIELDEQVIRVGKIKFHQNGVKQSATFEYDTKWLSHPERFALEPALQLSKNAYHTKNKQIIFGSIGDSAPDRWGRVLMQRAETYRAQSLSQTPRTLLELDYLLKVNDLSRQGALRFSENENGPFLATKEAVSIPPLVDLKRLLMATKRYLNDTETAKDLKLLLAPGSSLGGARPKASIIDKDGHLAIAKFPKKDDDFNISLWEAVALTLSEKARIKTSKWRLEKALVQSILIVRRFDRRDNKRIPFLSAMSMLQALDNETHSYLEIAGAIAQYGANPNKDLEELWRRIIFNILISNTDDHLRNHGFLYERNKGWRLSPCYDINPVPIEIKDRMLSTNINYVDPSASIDIALSVINDFRISKEKAKIIIKEVANAVSQWRLVAATFGLSNKEINRMQSAFEHEDLKKALEY